MIIVYLNKTMNIRELSRIQDSFIQLTDSTLDDYRETAKNLNSNFYANLLYRLSSIVRQITSSKSNKNSDIVREATIGDNKISIQYSSRDSKIAVYVNGDLAYSDKLGNNTAVNGTASAARNEVSGDILVKRDKGRTIQKERSELNPDFLAKKGLKFPKAIYKEISKDSQGNRMAVMKKNYKNQPILTEDEYSYLIRNNEVKESDYTKTAGVYVNNKNRLFRIKGDYNDLIQNFDEALAREDGFLDFYDSVEYSKKPAFVEYKGDIYKLYRGEIKKR